MAQIQTRNEVRRRRIRYQIFAGMFDFVAIIAGILVIIACVILLTSLFHWVVREGAASFQIFFKILNSALIIPET